MALFSSWTCDLSKRPKKLVFQRSFTKTLRVSNGTLNPNITSSAQRSPGTWSALTHESSKSQFSRCKPTLNLVVQRPFRPTSPRWSPLLAPTTFAKCGMFPSLPHKWWPRGTSSRVNFSLCSGTKTSRGFWPLVAARVKLRSGTQKSATRSPTTSKERWTPKHPRRPTFKMMMAIQTLKT